MEPIPLQSQTGSDAPSSHGRSPATNFLPRAAVPCLLLFLCLHPCRGQWSFTVVDSYYTGVCTAESLALDSAGDPHIAYLSSDQDTLWYAHWTGEGWDIQQVDTGIDSDLSGQISDVSIDVDGSGRPHISYNADTDHWDSDNFYLYSTHHLKYATLNGGVWDIQFVKRDADSVEWNSLAVDGDGRPHICYYSYVELPASPWFVNKVLYARWTGTEWVEEVVQQSNDLLGEYCSMALDSTGNPHVVYQWIEYPPGEYNPHLRYAVRTGSAWVSQQVNYEESWYLHLALGPDDSPHIAYCNPDDYALKYATGTGDLWNVSTVDDEYGTGLWSSIAVDANGSPHIGYSDGDYHLKYAEWSGGNWVKTVLDANGVSNGLSLALENGFEPRIAYYHIESSNAQLKYASAKLDLGGQEDDIPAPLAPSGTVSATRTPDFTWETVDGATWYQLFIRQQGGWEWAFWIKDTSSWISTSYEFENGDYEWWVQAWSESTGSSDWSDGLAFTIHVAPGADMPVPLTPSGTVTDTRTPQFTWGTVDGATWYQLFIRQEDGWKWAFWVQTNTWTSTNYEFENGTYQWWVQAWKPAGGASKWSESMSFAVDVASLVPPAATTLRKPTGTVTDARPTFAWDVVVGATWYHVWIARDGVRHYDKWVQGTSWTPDWDMTDYPGAYEWWVQTWGPGGYGEWSSAATFSVSIATLTVTGVWDARFDDGDTSVTVMTLAQNGTTVTGNVSGTNDSGAPWITYLVEGSFVGNQLHFIDSAGGSAEGDSVEFTAQIAGNSMSGTFRDRYYPETNSGTFTATRRSR